MTAVATYTVPTTDTRRPDLNFASHRSFSTPQTARLADWRENGRTASDTRTRQKRSLSPGPSFGLGLARAAQRDDESLSQAGTPTSRPRSWLRRFSSSMSTSRDSSRTPTSRPASAAVSQSNGSVAFSPAGSTTQMFPTSTPSQLPRNKLVKRSSSLRSTNSSPFQSSGSKLPLPVFKRPATSHQRSATLQDRLSSAQQSDSISLAQRSDETNDSQWRHYFTPKVSGQELSNGRRRSSTGIPNPIRRIYPDRKYRPILISTRELVRPAQVETDDGLSVDEEHGAVTKLKMVPSAASSPLPLQTAQFEEASTPRRSFSIGDLLSTGPQPLWRRPSSSKGRTSTSRSNRRGRQRVVSAPQTSMGSSLSRATVDDSERPAKRRDLTDPQAAQRSVYSSSGSSQRPDSQHQEIQLQLGSSTPQSQHLSFTSSPLLEAPFQATAPSPLEQRRLPSASADSATARNVRVSATQSEITSSTVGSDDERRSTGGFSTDYQSDTVYDSFPTRTTRSGSGKRGPPIDTIFDESPPSFSSGRSTKLRDLLNDGQFTGGSHGRGYRHSTIEEEESVVSTPVRSLHDKSVTSTPSARPGAQQIFASSPPAMSIMPDPDDIDWDAGDEPDFDRGLGIEQGVSTPVRSHLPPKSLPFRLSALSRSGMPTSTQSTPNRYSNGGIEKPNLFDWSEQQPSPSQTDQSPPRPRTVHGKKDPENRGSRAAGRRAPSGMHARSHSVPVVPDVEGKRSVVANKFGTWGVGSKAVTEDWNEDFDFEEEPVPPLPDISAFDEKRIDSGHAMFVPKSIREQQENVVANIGLLREWGLLIEELKDLRIRAVALGMLQGPHAPAWHEVDAMIELADQESEENTLAPRRSPPSSPGFDYSAFEGTPPPTADLDRLHEVPDSRPDSMLTDDEVGMLPTHLTPPHSMTAHAFAGRPRKDSEAVARSVIEALQSKRSVSDPSTLRPVTASKKVPFDTATLRHIVPYVNGLKRKVKDALRETEGLYSSPRRRSSPEDRQGTKRTSDDEPAFRSIFNEPGSSPIARRRSRREQAATDNDGFGEPFVDQRGNLAARIERLSLPHS